MGSEFLAHVPLFSELSEADLDRLCEMVEPVHLAQGETLFREGEPGDRAYVIEAGELEIVKQSGNREVLLAVCRPPEVVGEMSLLEEAPRMAGARARTPVRLLALTQKQLEELIRTSGSAARAMFFTVLARWRSTGSALRQSEKMAQLGTLTAGVAHELNNPAAAVRRGAEHLGAAYRAQQEAFVAVHALGLDPSQLAVLDELAASARDRAARPVELDALARGDREMELEDWLSDHGVPQPWDLAPVLVDLDLDESALQRLHDTFAARCLPPVARLLAATHAAANVLAEVRSGAERISAIVGALKQYSFLDQAPVQEVDVHEGIDNTLLILRGKLKGVSVRRDYAEDLPRILAHGSELNQVWTNLLDNAVDAMGGEGRIAIRTCRDGDWIMVEIADDGPGIPPAVKERIFDPFFTTKAPGKGTGQGLAIVWRIVVDEHRGSIRVLSEPGDTRFQVTLPIDFTTSGATPPAIDLEEEMEDGILDGTRTIAVVGISANPDAAAHTVPRFLQSKGYRIVPVNPKLTEVLGEPAAPDLASLAEPVDTVLVFRRSTEVPAVVDAAIEAGARSIWLQPGTANEDAIAKARRAGLAVVADRCMREAWMRLDASRRQKAASEP